MEEQPASAPLVGAKRLQELRAAVGTDDRPLLIAIHDYPDPDAIAAAAAMRTLAGSWGIKSVIAHGGILGREGNAEMVRLLNIELSAFRALDALDSYRGAVLLDTQPRAKNQSLPPEVPVLAVVDHHSLGSDGAECLVNRSPRGTTRRVYTDVRLDVGASSTLMAGYLEAAGITPDARLATALFLGIKTDTDSLLRDARPADVGAYTTLLPLADLAIAASVTHPPLECDYFRFMHQAMEKAVIHGGTLIAYCGEVRTPDMLSTASDALINLKDIVYALAVGFHDGRAYLSLRAKAPRADATRVLLHTVRPEGKGGGHNLSAGGFIDMGGEPEKWRDAIRARLLEATGDAGNSGENIIP